MRLILLAGIFYLFFLLKNKSIKLGDSLISHVELKILNFLVQLLRFFFFLISRLKSRLHLMLNKNRFILSCCFLTII